MRNTSANQSTRREGALKVEKMNGLDRYMLSKKLRHLGQDINGETAPDQRDRLCV